MPNNKVVLGDDLLKGIDESIYSSPYGVTGYTAPKSSNKLVEFRF